MRPAAEVVRASLGAITMHPLAFPVVSNVDAEPRTDPTSVKEALIRQVDAPVRWQTSIEWMAQAGVTHAIEIGPGKVLQGLVKRCAREVKLYGVSDAASLDGVQAFLSG